MTPRAYSQLIKRHTAEHERQEMLVGILAANIVNFSPAHPRKPARIADFMPSRWGREESDEEAAIRLMQEMSS